MSEPPTEGSTTTGEMHSTVEPYTVKPYTVKPYTVKPYSVEPYTIEPYTSEPNTVEPNTVKPNTVKPNTVKPYTVEPYTVKPYSTVEPSIVSKFPWTVIENPSPSYHSENKWDMRVLSKEQGGLTYKGPTIVWPRRWKHINCIYVMLPSQFGIYMAQSLNDRLHYQIKAVDGPSFLSDVRGFCDNNKQLKIEIISSDMNFVDANLIVVNNPSNPIRKYISNWDY